MDRLLLDRVAIWGVKATDGLSVKNQPAGRIYFENEIAKTTNTPTYRYAKNYEIKKGRKVLRFCLMMTSRSDSFSEIEAFLDDVSKRCEFGVIEKCLETEVGINYIDEFYRRDS